MQPPFYRVTRVKFLGREEVIEDIPWRKIEDRSDERAVRMSRDTQEERAEAFALARSLAAEGQHTRVYSSNDDGSLDERSLIWDSKTSDG